MKREKSQQDIQAIEKEKNDLIRRIEQLRRERGLSKTGMAELCNLSYSTLRNGVYDNRMPDFHTIKSICDGLEITLADFFTSPEIFGSETSSQELFMRYWNRMNRREKQLTVMFMEGILKEKD